jgi:hypothetical protein
VLAEPDTVAGGDLTRVWGVSANVLQSPGDTWHFLYGWFDGSPSDSLPKLCYIPRRSRRQSLAEVVHMAYEGLIAESITLPATEATRLRCITSTARRRPTQAWS